MGKYEKDKRKYRKEWETTAWGKGWLQHIDSAKYKNPNDLNEAYCKICENSLRSHLADLQKHARSKKHKARSDALDRRQHKSLTTYGYHAPMTAAKKIAEIKLAMYIIMHSSIRSVDHLGELLSVLGKGSKLEDLRMHRTKCSRLIIHVIAPVITKNLVDAVGDKSFSIIIDESTDVSVTKYLCMCIKYFDTTESRMITTFLGIVEVERAKAIDLHASIVKYLVEIGIPLKNLTAIGTDGASNLCGRNHSVFTLLKKDLPNLQLVKCTCHSLHLCASKASEELPSSLDFLAREVYNWFRVSSLRRINYRKTFDLINTGVDAQKFKQMIQLSRTRWLAFYEVVKRLLEQWVELQTHFRVACDAERCYTARTIRDMLDDDTNRLYLVFLKPILAEIQHLNYSFQSEKVDVGSLYDDICLGFLAFAKRVIEPDFLQVAMSTESPISHVVETVTNDLAFLPLLETDFGTDFERDIASSQLSKKKLNLVRQRCLNFLKKLLTEMAQRIPGNVETLRKIKLLSPSRCLSQVQGRFEDLPLREFLNPSCDDSVYKSQWDKLCFVDWREFYRGEIPSNVALFWPDVYKYTDACGRFVFRELAEAVLKMLTIPTSNAAVERAFSAVTLVKSKNRNKMRTEMLQSLLRIRMHLQAHNKCCKVFEPPTEMIDRFKSKFMYASTTSEDNNTNEDEECDANSLYDMLNIISEID